MKKAVHKICENLNDWRITVSQATEKIMSLINHENNTICPACGHQHPLVAEFGYCGSCASKIYGNDPY